jgi:TolB-like protein
MLEKRVQFGPFSFDPVTMQLQRDGVEIQVGSRGSAVLAVLLEARGNVVTKQRLLDTAWPGVIVEENNLAVQIAALRKALGEQQSGQDWIVNVPRIGYRMPIPARAAEQFEHRRPALAVLPFKNLGIHLEQEYLADGIVEDITTALSRFKSFAVVSRNSAQAYRGRSLDVRRVGEELGVRYVLEGAIRTAGGQLRVNAQLVETENGIQIWSNRFDGPAAALFEVQDKITDSVAAAIQPSVTRAEVERARLKRSSNLNAYDLYLQALPHLLSRDSKRALDLLEQALRLDPDFAPAAMLAGTEYLARYQHQALGSSEFDLTRGRELLQQVLPRCGSDSSLMSGCALMLLVMKEYDQALDLASRAVAENPNDSLALSAAGVINLFAGDLSAANDFQLRALALSPNEYRAHG